MKGQRPFRLLLMLLLIMAHSAVATAGPYAPGVEQSGTTAVAMGDTGLAAWATGWVDLQYGTEVAAEWQTPTKATGAATGNALDVVSLGRGGRITLTFAVPFKNGPGWDLAIFENSISDTFLELAFVEVSSNGMDFVRFPNDSRTPAPVSAYGGLDSTDIDGLAGKYRKGYGTPFDLEALAALSPVLSGIVDLNAVTHVRLIDIVGDGTALDSQGDVIYDPYPTVGSAGFDLEAVGIRYPESLDNTTPEAPRILSPSVVASQQSLEPLLGVAAFVYLDPTDRHAATRWQIGVASDFNLSACRYDLTSTRQLLQLKVPGGLLDPGITYFWRAAFIDSRSGLSNWSEVGRFTTDDTPLAPLSKQDWSDADQDIPTVETVDADGEHHTIGVKGGVAVERLQALDLDQAGSGGRPAIVSSAAIAFRLTSDPTETVSPVTIHLSKAAPAGHSWYDYDPDTGWQENEDAVFNDSRTQLVLKLEDGAVGDRDRVPNDRILVAGAVGGSAPAATPSDGSAGIEEPAGCFIASLQPAHPQARKLGGILALCLLPLCGYLWLKEQRQQKASK